VSDQPQPQVYDFERPVGLVVAVRALVLTVEVGDESRAEGHGDLVGLANITHVEVAHGLRLRPRTLAPQVGPRLRFQARELPLDLL
jgi:hypothetical protein